MLPPRYLLREDVILRLVNGRRRPCKIADIGCGGGEILVRLSQLGHSGVGYDTSPTARACARGRLVESHRQGFAILDNWPAEQNFDVVLLLEVLGYADDPVRLLRECRELLLPDGRLLLSFVRPGAGYDPRVVGDMRCFTPAEVCLLLEESGYGEIKTINYGYPLANALVGLMNRLHRRQVTLAEERGEQIETGLFHRSKWLAPLTIVSNRLVLKPFMILQRAFYKTGLGNGFVVSARIG